MKTARMTILMTPEEKAVIHSRAESLGVSTGEMVRRAVESYSTAANEPPSESEAVLNALADELFAAAKESRAALAAATRDIQATVKRLAKNRGVANVRV
ncbi:MAG: hypothetical protein HY066_07050 [Betaproteobacteria bacterium]|nr:hypothetical protein [Betaproteobacteria bacterium]